MKLVNLQKGFKFLTGVKFAIFLLTLIALASSLGSFIEQEESLSFYQQNYPITRPLFGILTWKVLLQFGFDHVYRTWWFFFLLFFLVLSLLSCTFTRQLPIFSNSKEYFFRKELKSFFSLPFFVKLQTISSLKETILLKIQDLDFYIYQKGNFLYGYKGLIGRISPILVHFSLIVILGGSSISALNNFKAQEVLPKGEIFHIQNPIQIGWFTSLPSVTTRVNDFWVEYENNRIHQFYSNLSILDNFGNELKQQTISVNHPFRYNNIDFYQSDWNLLGIRFEDIRTKEIYEAPLFPLEKPSKSWITWISISEFTGNKKQDQTFTLVFDQMQNTFFLYDNLGNFLNTRNLGDRLSIPFSIIDILPSTGLQMKYDPSIFLIYFGFGFLMITACLSYFPYTQIWVFHQPGNSWIGGSTNRGKINLEIEFENFVRFLEGFFWKKVN